MSKLFGFTQLISGKDGMLTQFLSDFTNVLSPGLSAEESVMGLSKGVRVCVFV